MVHLSPLFEFSFPVIVITVKKKIKMEQHSRPSGYVIPQLLQRKRPRALEGEMNPQQQQQQQQLQAQQQQPHITSSKNRLSKSEAAVLSNRVFECSELESLSLQITTAMIDIQKQIHRGEETYYEDTYAHGSLFRGWDAFVDAKDVGMSGSSSGSAQPTSRRVPADLRWFSSSCHVSRNSRPASLAIRQYSSSIGGGGINNNRPAPPVAGRQQAQVVADGANNSSTSFPPRLETTNTPITPAEGSNSNKSNVRVAAANASAVGSSNIQSGGGDKKPTPKQRDDTQQQQTVQGTPATTTPPAAQPSQPTKDSSVEQQPPLSGKKRKTAETTTKVGGTKKQSRTEEPATKKVP